MENNFNDITLKKNLKIMSQETQILGQKTKKPKISCFFFAKERPKVKLKEKVYCKSWFYNIGFNIIYTSRKIKIF